MIKLETEKETVKWFSFSIVDISNETWIKAEIL